MRTLRMRTIIKRSWRGRNRKGYRENEKKAVG
jgi:hypothetical protein